MMIAVHLREDYGDARPVFSPEWRRCELVHGSGLQLVSQRKYNRRWGREVRRGDWFQKLYSKTSFYVPSSKVQHVVGLFDEDFPVLSHEKYITLIEKIVQKCGIVLSQMHVSMWLCAHVDSLAENLLAGSTMRKMRFVECVEYKDIAQYKKHPRMAVTRRKGSASLVAQENGWLVFASIEHLRYLLTEAGLSSSLVNPLRAESKALGDAVSDAVRAEASCTDCETTSGFNACTSATAIQIIEENLVSDSNIALIFSLDELSFVDKLMFKNDDEAIRRLWGWLETIDVGEILCCSMCHDIEANIVSVKNLTIDQRSIIDADSAYYL